MPPQGGGRLLGFYHCIWGVLCLDLLFLDFINGAQVRGTTLPPLPFWCLPPDLTHYPSIPSIIKIKTKQKEKYKDKKS